MIEKGVTLDRFRTLSHLILSYYFFFSYWYVITRACTNKRMRSSWYCNNTFVDASRAHACRHTRRRM